jgi:hypothetical protein
MKNNFYKYYKQINTTKIYILLIIMFVFSIIYTFLDDTHFEGVNKYKEIIKEEIIKKKAQKEIIENFKDINNTLDNSLLDNSLLDNNNSNNSNSNNSNSKKETIIDETTKETEADVEKNELNPEKVKPTLSNKYFNRLYFSIVTGCLLGYGDIYPVSNISKLLCVCQGVTTVCLIII